MREIKFRAWDNLGKRMLYSKIFKNKSGYTIQSFLAFKVPKGYGRISSGQGYMGWAEMDLSEKMQYTGLEDKNGKEIYEGDLLRCNTNYQGEIAKGLVAKVEWNEIDARFDAYIDHIQSLASVLSWGNCEIIGNVYDDPELLKS